MLSMCTAVNIRVELLVRPVLPCRFIAVFLPVVAMKNRTISRACQNQHIISQSKYWSQTEREKDRISGEGNWSENFCTAIPYCLNPHPDICLSTVWTDQPATHVSAYLDSGKEFIPERHRSLHLEDKVNIKSDKQFSSYSLFPAYIRIFTYLSVR